MSPAGPWWCPVCHEPLEHDDAGHRWHCALGHSFDVARQGYVNLLRARGRVRQPGDSDEMVRARRAFLATGAFARVSDRLNDVIGRIAEGLTEGLATAGQGPEVLDVGCGEGYYTRRLAAALAGALAGPGRIAGVDLSRAAVASAAKQHASGYYAVASAFDLPVAPASIDIVMSVFGPIAAEELARVLRPAGAVVAVHPGPAHLFSLRQLVYEEDAVPHEIKDPLRSDTGRFSATGSTRVTYPLRVASAEASKQLLAMTPYRWHAGRDINERLDALDGLSTEVDVVISSYERTSAR